MIFEGSSGILKLEFDAVVVRFSRFPVRFVKAASILAAAWMAALALRAELPSRFPEEWTLDVRNRDAVRAWHNAVRAAVDRVEPGWTGSVAAQRAGTLQPDYRRAQLLLWNWCRALAGVPPRLVLDDAWSEAAQEAALMMAANGRLSHTPDTSWRAYSPAGAEAARWSNLALSLHGPQAIAGYLSDGLPGNESVSHRRWMLYPNLLRAGIGEIPGDATVPAAHVLWLLDPSGLAGGGPQRDGFVAWPPPGCVPHEVVPDRWSFTLPGADFRSAKVVMRRDGIDVAVRQESPVAGFGDATLVWVPEGRDPNAAYLPSWPAPATDANYDVVVSDVRVGSTSRSFAYRVTVFDVHQGGAWPRPVAPARAAVGDVLSIRPGADVPWSTPEMRLALRLPLAVRWGAEDGDPELIARVDSAVRAAEAAAEGRWGYRLLHLSLRDQVLEFPRAVVPKPGALLRFRSRLGYARSAEVARVDISLDEGGTWRALWSQRGRDDGQPVETAFVERRVSLGSFAGRRTRLRLVYAYVGGAYYNTVSPAVGWAVDQIVLEECEESADVARATGVPASPFPGPALAWWRPWFLGALPGEWSLPTPVEIVAPAPVDVAFANVSVRGLARSGDEALILGFVVEGATRRLLLRAVGEGLLPFGVHQVLRQPSLQVFRGAERVATASGSGGIAERMAERAVGAFPIATGGTDRVVVFDAPPGAYTVVVQPVPGVAPGVVLAEAYDLDGTGVAGGLGNVSVRGRVDAGEGALIPGFVLRGGEAHVLVRGLGPGLQGFGVRGWVSSPRIHVFRGAQLLTAGSRWTSTDASTILGLRSAMLRSGAFPLVEGDADAAIRVRLEPGAHSLVMTNEEGVPGVVLAEVYRER